MGRRNITNPLIAALDGGTGLPRLEISRLRAMWLRDCAELLGLATFMHAATNLYVLRSAQSRGRTAVLCSAGTGQGPVW